MQTTTTKRQAGSAKRGAPRKEPAAVVRCSAELAECTCPEWCERDHDRD